MKRLILVVLIQSLLFYRVMAQTSQPPKEMIEQIVALKTFLTHLKKGYQIVHSGLQTVNRIKNGDFNLHQLQFNKLQQISPAAKKTAAIYNTAIIQATLLLDCQQLARRLSQLKTLTKEEESFCFKTLQSFIDECKLVADDFIQLITAGELELKEDERINRILSIQQQTVRLDITVRSFGEQLTLLSQSRVQQQRSVDHSKLLNNL
ncbi:hypothetical protein [Lacibacter sp.]|uniref:hypothetical protein n=1 Tax=Lacibacter sp. TaxID=1915409 RepID=UPI002B4B2ABE|nr:hypothetical protein [Lacibacter sp.]HLP37766.1 hypothetical protein [Lacibacter sp.]